MMRSNQWPAERPRTRFWRRSAAAVLVVIACTAVNPAAAQTATFDGFTEPIRTFHLAVAEPGRVDEVSVERGDRVAAGDRLLRLDCGPIQSRRRIAAFEAASTTEIDRLRIDAASKRSRLRRLEKLLQGGSINPEELRRGRADADVADLLVAAAEDRHELANIEVEKIDQQIAQRCVHAPVDGLVVDVRRRRGEYVSTADPEVVTLVQLDQLMATFFVDTPSATTLTIGQDVLLNIEHRDKPVVASVLYVAAVTDADSGRVRVQCVIENPDRRYRSGLRCTLTIPGQTRLSRLNRRIDSSGAPR